MDWPGAWNQAAWSVALGAAGLCIGAGGLLFAFLAFRRAGTASQYAKAALRLATRQTAVANVARLHAVSQQVDIAAVVNEQQLARFALSEWGNTASETLGLLGDLDDGAEEEPPVSDFRAALGSSIEFARIAQLALHGEGTTGDVKQCTEKAMEAILTAVSAGQEAAPHLRARLSVEATQ